jgi:2-amino-4-hydroxy-6-hydroxymethyldihydropteridine diphosphokinase
VDGVGQAGGAAQATQVPVAVALGSNLGSREEHLHDAARRLGGFIPDCRVSGAFETDYVGPGGAQPPYLNAAAIGHTTLTARELLLALLEIERSLGRTRPFPEAPRTVDLDLILYGLDVIDEPGLVVPHPRFRQRRFVLQPLAEIAPDWRDPVSGHRIDELLRALN